IPLGRGSTGPDPGATGDRCEKRTGASSAPSRLVGALQNLTQLLRVSKPYRPRRAGTAILSLTSLTGKADSREKRAEQRGRLAGAKVSSSHATPILSGPGPTSMPAE